MNPLRRSFGSHRRRLPAKRRRDAAEVVVLAEVGSRRVAGELDAALDASWRWCRYDYLKLNNDKRCIYIFIDVHFNRYMYVHVYIHLYLYTSTYIHTCIHTYIHSYIHT